MRTTRYKIFCIQPKKIFIELLDMIDSICKKEGFKEGSYMEVKDLFKLSHVLILYNNNKKPIKIECSISLELLENNLKKSKDFINDTMYKLTIKELIKRGLHNESY